MKILQVIPFFTPALSFGGPVKVCQQISSELSKKGDSVTVWTTDAADTDNPITKYDEIVNGISIKRFKNFFPKLTHGYNIFTPIGFSSYATKTISKYDVVHCHSFFTYQNIIISRVCRKHKVPYIIHLHETPIPNDLLGKKIIKSTYNRFFGKKILLNADSIIVVSSREKDLLSDYLPELNKRIFVVPNPIEKYEFNPSLKKTAKDSKTILCLGRLSFIKSIDNLVLSFAELLKKDDLYKLIIAGPNENKTLPKLQKLVNDLAIADKVEFTGLITGEAKEKVFYRSDIFALFSDYESFSVASLEALQHNLPCCLSNNIGIAPQIEQSGAGVVVADTKNFSECAEKMKFVYENRYNLSKNCSKILPLFEISVIMNLIRTIYKKAIQ
ncbi:MAG: glycosyltransferase [Candidatus Berkelbacteria bacterium]